MAAKAEVVALLNAIQYAINSNSSKLSDDWENEMKYYKTDSTGRWSPSYQCEVKEPAWALYTGGAVVAIIIAVVLFLFIPKAQALNLLGAYASAGAENKPVKYERKQKKKKQETAPQTGSEMCVGGYLVWADGTISRCEVIGVEGLALLCLTLNVFKEARGEPAVGQLAVAFVTLNRAKQTGDVCDTVFAPNQFSWVATDTTGGVLLPHKRPDRKSREWKQAEAVAKVAFYAKDFTHGATHFHGVSMTPTWAKKLKFVGKYGEHRFYREK